MGKVKDNGWNSPKSGRSYTVGYPEGVNANMYTTGMRIKLKQRLSVRFKTWIKVKLGILSSCCQAKTYDDGYHFYQICSKCDKRVK